MKADNLKRKTHKVTVKANAPREVNTEKVAQILQGAMQEFLVHGYAGTSMDRVAGTAGVSKATVYSYFEDKEALFVALVERLAQTEFQMIFDEKLIQGKPEDVLRRIATTLLNEILSNPDYLTFIRLMIGESGRFPNLAKTFINNITKPAIERLTHYLENCPELKVPDPEASARIFLSSLVHHIQLQEAMYAKEIIPIESDRIINTLIYLLLGKKE